MAIIAVAKVGVTLKFDDGYEFLMFEGDTVHDLEYKAGKDVCTLDGKVRVICGTTKAQTGGPADCPPNPYVHKSITPTMLIIDSSDEHDAILTRVAISDIISIGGVDDGSDPNTMVIGPGAEYKDLADVVAEAEDGAVIKLMEGTYEAPMVVDKSLTLIGVGDNVTLTSPLTIGSAGVAAQSAEALADAAVPTTKTGIDVVLAGLKLTGDAVINVTGADSLVMTNCTFGGHNLTKKTMPIAITYKGDMSLVIEDNVFEEENEFSYNLIDCYAQLKTGSSISGNTFKAGCCKHNQISLYGIANGATVDVNDNHVEMSANMIRIGFIGEPKGIVNMVGNSYDATDVSHDGKYAGLFLVQPYGNKTSTFGNVKINVQDTTAPEGNYQIGYIYAGTKDTQWTADNKPLIYIDGKKVTIPDSSDVV